ncbi:uncharacterized protein BJ171DRAFT_520386 [Polychytrium aggregatum]|uniref:uncharacterized protein n=1 Tax=Polychytrium aggregatum TaxID=110093 RepID=UPI0022FF2C42|nr:uncharacterized protein BJ171DRAFT_520386 [Polychytrium aggregatum]KAI9197256.1 hypothetical protein BJ171DRAFT_520386 [Polychytrium aggregatum]
MADRYAHSDDEGDQDPPHDPGFIDDISTDTSDSDSDGDDNLDASMADLAPKQPGSAEVSENNRQSVAGPDEASPMPLDVAFGASVPAPTGMGEENPELKQLDESLLANPYQYELHIKRIRLLQSTAEPNRLQGAREAMSTYYPLTEDLWLEWIDDLCRLDSSISGKQAAAALFDRAIQDYFSVRVWAAYLRFVCNEYLVSHGLKLVHEDIDDSDDEDGDEGDEDHLSHDGELGIRKHPYLVSDRWIALDQVREVCGRAVNAVELHPTEGQQVWTIHFRFEVRLLENGQSSVETVRHVLLKRLQVPHQEIDETFSKYSSFETKYDGANYEKRLRSAQPSYSKAKAEFEAREPYERRLSESKLGLAEFVDYIDYEKTVKPVNKMRVRLLFERAVTVHCLHPMPWDLFISFLMANMRIANVILSVANRAVRNCSWSVDLWGHLLRAQEEFATTEEVEDTFRRAIGFLSANSNIDDLVKICEARIAFHRRRLTAGPGHLNQEAMDTIRQIYQDSISSIAQHLPPGDPYYRLQRSWIRLEHRVFGETDRARSLYKELVEQNSKSSTLWLDYIEFMRNLGAAASEIVGLFKVAVNHKTDWPETIFTAWLSFEQESGSIESYYEAYNRIKKETRAVELQRQKEAKALEVQAQMEAELAEREAKKTQRQKDRERTYRLRRREQDKLKERQNKRAHAGDDDFAVEKRQKVERETEEEDQFKPVDQSMAGNMVCCSGYQGEWTEAQLEEHFSEHGHIKDIIPIVDPDTNEPETLIEFYDVASCRSASAEHEVLIAPGKVMKVLRCIPLQRTWNFVDVDIKNKIFIKNLSQSMRQRTLREIFSQFGAVKEVRLMQSRNGLNNFAYLEFQSEEAASKSLSLDKTEIEPGRFVGVALSAPPGAKASHNQADPKQLFVANLPKKDFTEADLRELFKEAGQIKSVRLLRTQDQALRGLAFVAFHTEEAAQIALQVDGSLVQGRKIAVSVSDPNSKGKKGGARNVNAPDNNAGGFRGSTQKPRPGLGFQGTAQTRAPAPAAAASSAQAGFFLPTVLQRKPRLDVPRKPKAAPAASPMAVDEPLAPTPAEKGAPKEGKSQDDFRKMFLKK